jgi:excisionase family DNA binding protein
MAQAAARETGNKWMSIGEAARMVRLSAGTVYRKIREGKLAAFERVGKTSLRRRDVDAFMKPRRIRPSQSGKR